MELGCREHPLVVQHRPQGRRVLRANGGVVGGVGVYTLQSPAVVQSDAAEPVLSGADLGRHLIRVGGCNDCHTPGFMELGERIDESLWLTGVPVGWRGPWGTTYASNLRRFVQPFTEAQFIHVVRTRNSRPPMPWMSLHAMSDRDLASIYRYIKSLPLVGDEMPDYVPPDQEPKTPYLDMSPQNLPVAAANAPTAG